MTHQDTQPPAETLAECPFCGADAVWREDDPAKPSAVFGLVVDHSSECFLRWSSSVRDDQSIRAAWNRRAALTRRAGGDAIPAGDGQDRKFAFRNGQFVNRVSGEPIPHDEPVIIFRARDRHAIPVLREYLTMATDEHHRQAIRDRLAEFSTYREAHPDRMKEPGITHHIELNAIPQPPAGGDAGAVERAAGFMRHDGLCAAVGAYGYCDCGMEAAKAAALAIPAPVVEGWQPIETAILWGVYIVTDGEHVALAQYAESDWGGNYWAVDPEDALEWSPTHCITPPAALSEGRSHG